MLSHDEKSKSLGRHICDCRTAYYPSATHRASIRAYETRGYQVCCWGALTLYDPSQGKDGPV